MPTTATPNSDASGFVDPMNFTKQYPQLSFHLASKTATEAGMDPSDPKNLMTAMHSNTFQQRMRDVSSAADAQDSQKLSQLLSPQVDTTMPNSVSDSGMVGAYQQKADVLSRIAQAKGIAAGMQTRAQSRLDQLSQLNENMYKSQRIAEMNPTADIDNQIASMREQSLVSQASLQSQIKDLPFSMQQAVLLQRDKMFQDHIADLNNLRTARLDAATNQVQSELDMHRSQITTSQARVDALKQAITSIEGQGQSLEAIPQLKIDLMKELRTLNKATGNGASSGYIDLMSMLPGAQNKSPATGGAAAPGNGAPDFQTWLSQQQDTAHQSFGPDKVAQMKKQYDSQYADHVMSPDTQSSQADTSQRWQDVQSTADTMRSGMKTKFELEQFDKSLQDAAHRGDIKTAENIVEGGKKPVPPKELSDFGDAAQLLRDMQNLKAIYQEASKAGHVGPVAGLLQKDNPYNEDIKVLQASIAQNIIGLSRGRYNQALRGPDAEQLKKMHGDPQYPIDASLKILDNTSKSLQDALNSRIRVLKQNYQTQSMADEMDSASSYTAPASTTAPTDPTTSNYLNTLGLH